MNMTAIQRILHSKAVISLIAVLIIYALSGFFMAPYLVSRFVPDMVAEKLHRELRMGTVKINPFLLLVKIPVFWISGIPSSSWC